LGFEPPFGPFGVQSKGPDPERGAAHRSRPLLGVLRPGCGENFLSPRKQIPFYFMLNVLILNPPNLPKKHNSLFDSAENEHKVVEKENFPIVFSVFLLRKK